MRHAPLRLNVSIEGFDEAAGRQTAGAGARVTAGAELDSALERAEGELARLDAAVRNKFRADAAALTSWERARAGWSVPPCARARMGTARRPPRPSRRR